MLLPATMIAESSGGTDRSRLLLLLLLLDVPERPSRGTLLVGCCLNRQLYVYALAAVYLSCECGLVWQCVTRLQRGHLELLLGACCLIANSGCMSLIE